ncbi:ABC transporter permease [Streptomyces phaeochromogenes]|uniref:ABC transporter permease n=1 Tax=Streptomyces phaeochromogenes TaxID=1923 RepID=UPI0033D0EB8E
MSKVRRWASRTLAASSVLMLIMTVVVPQWIEAVFRVEPDGGDGSLEVMVVIALAALAVITCLDVALEVRRARRSSTATQAR